jgi:hypothetical protein
MGNETQSMNQSLVKIGGLSKQEIDNKTKANTFLNYPNYMYQQDFSQMPYYYYPPYNQDILANKPYYFPYDQYQQQQQQQTSNNYSPEISENNKKESNKIKNKKQDETTLPNFYSFGQNNYFSYYPANYSHYNEASNYYQQAYSQQQMHNTNFGSPKITVKDYIIPLDEYQTPELSRRKYKKHHISD